MTVPICLPMPTFQRWAARVILAATVVVAASWLLAGGIEQLLLTPAVASMDELAAEAAHAHATRALLALMAAVSLVHGSAGILGMAALLAAWLWQRGQHAALAGLLATVPGGLLLNVAVKQAVHRARPNRGDAAERLASFSWPSGHTAGATVFYGFVTLLLWPRCRSGLQRAALLVIAAAMVVLVAESRILLGMHYLSDCVAAVAEGLLWVAVCRAPSRPACPAAFAERAVPR